MDFLSGPQRPDPSEVSTKLDVVGVTLFQDLLESVTCCPHNIPVGVRTLQVFRALLACAVVDEVMRVYDHFLECWEVECSEESCLRGDSVTALTWCSRGASNEHKSRMLPTN
jgi:hypothetical protein